MSPQDRTARHPALLKLLRKIAEPRSESVGYFIVYGLMAAGGVLVLIEHPMLFVDVLGDQLTVWFGVFATFGGVAAAIAVLPGWYWLERVGIYSIVAGLALYGVVTTNAGITATGLLFSLAFIIGAFFIRWNRIRTRQTAPKRG